MENEKVSRGVVANDPADSMPDGGAVHFQSLLVPYTPSTTSAWIRDWESLDGMLLAISFAEPSFHTVEGSAILVAPGFALCAWHVLEDRIEALATGKHSITCFGISANGLQIWKVRKITSVPNSDLAILGLELASNLPDDSTFYKTVATTRLPKINERVTIFGFRSSSEKYERTAESGMNFDGNLLVCAGEVVDRFPTGRDRVMMPWPSLEVACPSWGGMSGGPVFNSEGEIIGLLSTSFSTTDGNGPSYISLLIPALTAGFEGGWPAPLFRGRTTLLELDHRLFQLTG